MSTLEEPVQRTPPRGSLPTAISARAAGLGIYRGSVVANAASLFGTTVITSLLGFAFWLVAAHMFSRAVVGAGGAALSAMQLIANAGMLGLGTLLIGELSRRVEHPARLITTALCASAAAGIIGGLAIAVGARAVSSSGMIPNGIAGLALFAATAGVYGALLVLDDATVGLSRASWQLWRNGVFSVVKLALLPVVALALGLQGSSGLLLSWLGGAVLSILVITLLARRANLRLLAWPRRALIGSYRGTALLHHWLNLSSGAPILVLPMIVAAYLTPAANAPFYSALLLIGFAYIASTHLGTALFGVASGDHSALKRELRRTIKICAAVGFGAVVVFGAGGHLLLLMFGSGYTEASLPLAILAVGTFPGSVRSQYTAVCRVNGDLRRCALCGCVGSGLEILLPLAALASGGGLVLVSCAWVAAMLLEAMVLWPAVACGAGYPGRFPRLTRWVAPRTFALTCPGPSHTSELDLRPGSGAAPLSVAPVANDKPQRDDPHRGVSLRQSTVDRLPVGNGTRLDKKTLVFVGGMHRSGTSVIARALAQHPLASGLTNTGVVEDEGQYLQSVYLPDEAYGGPGQFALNPEAHLTEQARFLTPGAREQLLREWSLYWDTSKRVLVEKTPAHLIQTRFLRALFPDAYFLIVMRHPVASALATRKWVDWRARRRHPWRLLRLLENWLTGYELFLRDCARLSPARVLLVRYEDFVVAPAASLAHIGRALGIEDGTAPTQVPDALTKINDRYFAQWTHSWWAPLRNVYHGRLARRLERRARVFGYSLESPWSSPVPTPGISRLLVSGGRAPEDSEHVAPLQLALLEEANHALPALRQA